GLCRFSDSFSVRVYSNHISPVTRKTRPPLKPMGLRGADVAIPFRCSARPHRVWSRLAGVGFKCRNQELNAFPMDGDPPSKVGYRRATRKYMLTSRFTAYDPKRKEKASARVNASVAFNEALESPGEFLPRSQDRHRPMPPF